MFSRLEESFLGKKSIFHSSDSADFEDLIEDYFQIFTTEYYHFENLLFWKFIVQVKRNKCADFQKCPDKICLR